MAPSPFSHQALASTMAASVPASTSPHLTSAHEVVALAVHAAMANAGYRIVGLGEDDRIGEYGQCRWLTGSRLLISG